jgi:hypothetical protein
MDKISCSWLNNNVHQRTCDFFFAWNIIMFLIFWNGCVYSFTRGNWLHEASNEVKGIMDSKICPCILSFMEKMKQMNISKINNLVTFVTKQLTSCEWKQLNHILKHSIEIRGRHKKHVVDNPF